MENDNTIIEYISEWPINGTRSQDNDIQSLSGMGSFLWRRVKSYANEKTNPPKKLNLSQRSGEELEEEPVANVSLSRWWKTTGKTLLSDEQELPDSVNPNTLISFISRSGPGIEYIQSEIRRLRCKIQDGERRPDVYAALSSFYEKMGNLSLAITHMEGAIEKCPDNSEYKWMIAKLKRMYNVRAAQEKVLVKMNINSESSRDGVLKFPKQVMRVHIEDLSYADFFYKFALTSTPVVITGLATKMTVAPWTMQHIKERAGNCFVTVKKTIPASVEWARLEDAKRITVGEYIDKILSDDSSEKTYLFDWSLPLNCPQLAEEITMPKYFAGDFLQRTMAGSLYKDSWPSLFIAPAGLTSELHVDAFASNFWMALFQGRKRWVFFDPVDLPMLYPRYEHSFDPVFDVDLSCPDLEQYPLLRNVQPRECILEPGDVLFVPAGCPHRVENLDKSLAISGNFVDLSNFSRVKDELQINSLLDPRARQLLDQFMEEGFRCNMSSDITDMKWEDYKGAVHANYEHYEITPETVKECFSELN
ncbi:hypothetical protein CHS0354_005717 [Potamilus streckersoni]|nr:hypothetical protein CHS0354_005717 [Potamilus streckersoni]